MYKDEIFENAVLIGFDARQGYLFLIAGEDNADVYYWDDGYTFEESIASNAQHIVKWLLSVM